MSSRSDNQPEKFPAWAERADRAVPHIPVPRLSTADVADVLGRQRVLVCLLVGRPWLAFAAFGLCAHNRWWAGLLLATWFAYGGSIAAVHQLIHSSLGLPPSLRRVILVATAAMVLESGHSLQATHLLHHRTDLTTPDPEGYIEYVSWKRMPVEALRFRYRLMWWGLHFGPRRTRIRTEVGFHVVAHVTALAMIPWTVVPALYLVAMLCASSIFAVLAGKGPQTNFGRPVSTPFVKVSARLFGAVLFSHDRHLEHHAYPKVPLSRLRHLDQLLAPVFAGLTVTEVSLP